jgi:hypothetical protein
MATHADILWDARNSASISAVSESLSAVSTRSASPKSSRSPDRRARSPDRRQDGKGRGRKPTPGRRICNNHRKFGNKTFNCQGNCDFAEN